MSRSSHAGVEASARALSAVLGGYALAWCFTAFVSRALPAATGMAPSDAVMTASMLSFVVYLLAILRVFSLGSAKRAAFEPLAVAASFAAASALLPLPARLAA